jgi:hypothetical protein
MIGLAYVLMPEQKLYAHKDPLTYIIIRPYIREVRMVAMFVLSPLPSNERLLWLHYSSFQASRHSIMNDELQRIW